MVVVVKRKRRVHRKPVLRHNCVSSCPDNKAGFKCRGHVDHLESLSASQYDACKGRFDAFAKSQEDVRAHPWPNLKELVTLSAKFDIPRDSGRVTIQEGRAAPPPNSLLATELGSSLLRPKKRIVWIVGVHTDATVDVEFFCGSGTSRAVVRINKVHYSNVKRIERRQTTENKLSFIDHACIKQGVRALAILQADYLQKQRNKLSKARRKGQQPPPVTVPKFTKPELHNGAHVVYRVIGQPRPPPLLRLELAPAPPPRQTRQTPSTQPPPPPMAKDRGAECGVPGDGDSIDVSWEDDEDDEAEITTHRVTVLVLTDGIFVVGVDADGSLFVVGFDADADDWTWPNDHPA
ncbi:hypothetical protein M885DRAFT_550343, partial [Pelagophyceae sp. CCMP2097]